jgi:hypothetical protein
VIECGSLEYAQARLQSRHGERASESAWQQLETARELPALLQTARGSALRRWVAGLTASASAAQIEAVLRAQWRAAVAEVTGWMPGAWQPALAWCAVLPELPWLQHLARGGEAQPWMHDDAAWGTLYAAPPQARAAALAGGPWGALIVAWSAPTRLAQAWQDEWTRRLPEPLREADDSLRQLLAVCLRHAANFDAAPPGPGGLLRRDLQARLALLLRRSTLQPAAAFIHLALSALDLERLRGELLRRVLFPHAKGA